MLDALKKALGHKTVEATMEVKLTAEDVMAAVQAAVAELKVEFDTYKTTADAAMAEAAEKVTGLQAELADMAAKLAEANAALASAETAKVAAAAEAAAAKLSARKEKLVAALGTERADALMKVTEGMEDAAFDAVISALGVAASVEAEDPMFNEAGVDAKADAGKVVEESKEMKILRAQYAKK